MALEPGTRLGPYEVAGPLGAGGMGEVYRARDTRLGRDVAIKVLPESCARDEGRLRRFEQEARAVAALNHPNILTLFDIGTQDGGAPYLALELLEGETLRDALERGPMRSRRALEIGRDIASALAAAHDKGVIHRDLKPENVFLTREGRAKVLDFGLAKLAQTEGTGSQGPTTTKEGLLVGTAGYMSPEQARGREVDVRSDIFAFGSVLYEMLSGQRAFQSETAAETLTAILREEPRELPTGDGAISPALERLVRHCLEKDPARRFQSAQDLAFDLDGLSGASPSPSSVAPLGVARGFDRRRWLGLAGSALAGGAATAGGLVAAGLLAPGKDWTSKRVTFRRGHVSNARLTPDGKTVVYSAAWDGEPYRIFTARVGSAEATALPLGEGDVRLLAVSRKEELAVAFGPGNAPYTLARVPLSGGAPKLVVEGVRFADWGPDGETLAVARSDRTGLFGSAGLPARRLEFPIGRTLHEVDPPGFIGPLRVSADGRRVAFSHVTDQDRLEIAVIEAAPAPKRLSEMPAFVAFETEVGGLCWSPDGREVWFVGPERGGMPVSAVNLAGDERVLFRGLGHVGICDAVGSRSLLMRRTRRWSLLALPPGQSRERDLGWLDSSALKDMSRDGRLVLFGEEGAGGGPRGSVYVRSTDGSAAIKVAEGEGLALSADGKWVASRMEPTTLLISPVGPGEPRTLSTGSLVPTWVWFLLDGSGLYIYGNEAKGPFRHYVLPLSGGPPRAITPVDVSGSVAFSPDGRWAAAAKPDGSLTAYSLGGEAPRPLPRLEPGEGPIQWSGDGRSVFVTRLLVLPAPISRLDLATGSRQPWLTLMPNDPAGTFPVNDIFMTPDGRAYSYSVARVLDELHVVEGIG